MAEMVANGRTSLAPEYVIIRAVQFFTGRLREWLAIAGFSVSALGTHEALAYDKGPPSSVISALGSGQHQDLLVLLDDSTVRGEAAELRARAKFPYDDPGILALKAARYVALKQGVLDDFATADELAVLQDYRHLPMMFLRFRSLRALRRIVDNPAVIAVYEVRANRPLLTESLSLIHQPEVAAAGQLGVATTVAVLDTGVEYTRPAFGSCAAPGVPVSCRVIYAKDFTPTDDGMLDDSGHHGTNVAATVVGVAPGTRIAALDVFRADGYAYDSDIILAIDWAIQHQWSLNIVAMNLSLGIGGYSESCPTDPLAVPIANAKEAGILPIVASGNDGYLDRVSRPACAPAAVSVGAVYDSDVGVYVNSCVDFFTYGDLVTCFSNTAAFLTMLAPGCRITAGSPAGGGPDLTLCGTSQAAPHVAGAAAVLRAGFPSEVLDQTIFRMTSSGVPVPDRGSTYTRPRLHMWAATLVPTLSVSLTADPAAGMAPLTAALSAEASGTARGTLNYTFWWNCSDPGISVAGVRPVCGDPTDSAIGAKLDAVTANPMVVSHAYFSPGTYIAKVITERGAAAPAEARATVVVGLACGAGQLPLNGDRGGMLGASPASETWCITTTVDGTLGVNVDSGTPLSAQLALYDVDGAPLTSTGCGGYVSVSNWALRPGTYFASVGRCASSVGSYTISNTFTPAALANDVEPNDTSSAAQALALGGSTTGHLGYYSAGFTDFIDWFKVTTTVDGTLGVNVDSGTLSVQLALYDVDGAPLTLTGCGGYVSVSNWALRPGTYFASVGRCASSVGSYTISNTFTPAAQHFFTVTPCRVADTRDATGPFGGPLLSAGTERAFTIAGRCGVPPTAKAVSLNVTVTEPTAPGHISLYPGGTSLPLASALNYRPGQTRANNAVVPLGVGGTLAVFCGQGVGTTHFIIDINGYFE